MAPLVLLAALTSGVLAGEQLGAGPGRLLLGSAVVGFALAFLGRGTRTAVCAAVLACALLGVAVEQRALHGLERSPLTAAVAGDARGEAILTLAEDPDGPT